MKNFYYVVSLNLTNPIIKTMLETSGVTKMTGMVVDFKLRSKLFMSYSESINAITEDFKKKILSIYGIIDEQYISKFIVMNPLIFHPDHAEVNVIDGNYYTWDENCFSVIFYVDNPEGDDELPITANSWMFKYEIFFTEDAIELSRNGDHIFSSMDIPITELSSSYH